jgi:hypothetical protein
MTNEEIRKQLDLKLPDHTHVILDELGLTIEDVTSGTCRWGSPPPYVWDRQGDILIDISYSYIAFIDGDTIFTGYDLVSNFDGSKILLGAYYVDHPSIYERKQKYV